MAAALRSNPFARLDLRAAVDILIIAVLIYYLLKLLRGTRAVQILLAVLLLVALYEGARWAQFEMVEWLLTTLLPYVAIALIVLFQPEIRPGAGPLRAQSHVRAVFLEHGRRRRSTTWCWRRAIFRRIASAR